MKYHDFEKKCSDTVDPIIYILNLLQGSIIETLTLLRGPDSVKLVCKCS